MEIPQDKPTFRKASFVLITVLIIISLVVFNVFMLKVFSGDGVKSTSQLNVDTVYRAKLIDDIAAYGLLKPQNVTSLIAAVPGTVKQINVRPGEMLRQGDVILQLVNPDLQRKLEDAELAVLQRQAEQEKLKVRVEQQQRALNNNVKMASSKFKLRANELLARELLVSKHIISSLDFEKAKLELEQAELTKSLADEQQQAFELTKQIELSLAEIQLAKANKQLTIAQQNVERLMIRANMDGMLSEFNEQIKPGQFIASGLPVGLMADPTSLYAELQVTASEVPKVELGQSVQLRIKGAPVEGEVMRISPNVKSNQVQVDVALPIELPQVARSYIEVSGNIIIKKYTESWLAKKPVTINKSNMSYQLYLKSIDSATFEPRQVKIGAVSNKYMQIIDGVKAGDQILLTGSNSFDFNGNDWN